LDPSEWRRKVKQSRQTAVSGGKASSGLGRQATERLRQQNAPVICTAGNGGINPDQMGLAI